MNILDRFLKENYSYGITRATVIRDTGVLKLEISLNFVVPFDQLQPVEQMLKEKIPGASRVEMVFHYVEMAMSRREILQGYLDYMIAYLERSHGAVARAIQVNQIGRASCRERV